MARNHVNVKMKNRLTRRGARIEADVVAVGLRPPLQPSPFLNQRSRPTNGRCQSRLLIRGGLKPVGHVPPGNQKRVAG